MIKSVTSWSLIACMALFAIGCGRGTMRSTPKESFKQTTPKDTFEGYKAAVSKNDWSISFQYFAEDTHNRTLELYVNICRIEVGLSGDGEKYKTLENLLEKHGIESATSKKQPTGDPEAKTTSFVSGVKNKGAFYEDLLNFLKDMPEAEEKYFKRAKELKKAVFEEAKIDGDTATVTYTTDSKDENHRMIFKKTNGKWFIKRFLQHNAGKKQRRERQQTHQK